MSGGPSVLYYAGGFGEFASSFGRRDLAVFIFCRICGGFSSTSTGVPWTQTLLPRPAGAIPEIASRRNQAVCRSPSACLSAIHLSSIRLLLYRDRLALGQELHVQLLDLGPEGRHILGEQLVEIGQHLAGFRLGPLQVDELGRGGSVVRRADRPRGVVEPVLRVGLGHDALRPLRLPEPLLEVVELLAQL